MKSLGASSMRIFTAKRLRELAEPVLVTHHGDPVAVMVPYQTFLDLQRLRETIRSYVEKAGA